MEQQTVDARFSLARRHLPSGDILLLLLDDASLDADATFVAQRADQFGVDLQRVFDAGARGVALDFQLPKAWSSSVPFSQLALRHSDRLTLAAYSSPSGEVIGPEVISGVTTVALGPERASALFGFINLDQDDDGVSRRARLVYHDREGSPRQSFAARAASTLRGGSQVALPGDSDGFWIDHTIDPARFERVGWKDLDATLGTRPERFRDKLVIVGADYSGSGDEVRVPNLDAIPGVVLHALIVETILSGFPVRGVDTTAVALVAGVTCGLLCAALLVSTDQNRAVVNVSVAGAAYFAGTFLIFHFFKVLLPSVGPVLLLGIGAAVAWWIRRSRTAFPLA
jgi:CHASE2 domain-containing sensor protein